MQSTQFGTSAYLQSTDFQTKADIDPASSGYTQTPTTLSFALNTAAVAHITASGNQFRVELSLATFSNFNGTMRTQGVNNTDGGVYHAVRWIAVDVLCDDQTCWVGVVQCASLSGCYRCNNIGSDVLMYYGSTAPLSVRPQLQLIITGPGPTIPVPIPVFPLGNRGTIVAGSTTSIEITCDGGPSGIFDGYVASEHDHSTRL